jgi:hypothetical protein
MPPSQQMSQEIPLESDLVSSLIFYIGFNVADIYSENSGRV